ncbi:MAG: hypothetical protein RL662_697 [Bacteroidota bacterium]|jgi:type II restriction enzyme
MITGNKGEWSEIYTLFKLLADKQVYAGNGNLNRVDDLFYPILKIIREEENVYDYTIASGDIVIISTANEELLRIPISEFKNQADSLFHTIKTGKGAFTSTQTASFMQSVYCSRLKAKSSDKTDIKIVIHDLRTGICPTLGFSIKSKMGNPSTLINASGATNFCYRVTGTKLTPQQLTEINGIDTRSKIKDRIAKIKELGATLSYVGIDSSIFYNNLVLIDSSLPLIVSQMLLMYFSGMGTRVSDLSKQLQDKNPLDYELQHKHQFYEYKIKRLLSDAALGMKPATVWSGTFEANGGYLVVKEDGDVLCYHIYNRNDFEDYLLNTSFMDTPSSSRHGFGTIEEKEGEQFLKLNIQVRFL